MNDQPQQIEAIVREVLRRIRALDNGSAASNASADVPNGTGSSTSPLHWEQPLVTWTRLASRLDGYAHVTFPPRAIVTPLVKDELQQRGIRWTVREATYSDNTENSDNSKPGAKATRRLLVWGKDDSKQREVASLLAKQLTSSAVQVTTALDSPPGNSDDSPSATSPNAISGKVGSLQNAETRAIVLSKTPYRCCCDFNRHQEVCAVVVSHAAHVVQMVREARPNVLVFDLVRQPFSEILHAMRIYLRHWPGDARASDYSSRKG